MSESLIITITRSTIPKKQPAHPTRRWSAPTELEALERTTRISRRARMLADAVQKAGKRRLMFLNYFLIFDNSYSTTAWGWDKDAR